MTMLFSLPGLDWDKEVTHVETFAGCASVTRGEIEACIWECPYKNSLCSPEIIPVKMFWCLTYFDVGGLA